MSNDNESPPPIIYICIQANKADRVFAPSIRADSHEAFCADCACQIVYLGERFHEILGFALANHRDLLLVCENCAEARMAEAEDAQYLNLQLSEERAAVQRQWELERN